MSIRNKEGQAGERRAPKQRYEEQHVVITLSEKQPLQMCTWGLLLLMLVCDQRFSDLSRQNYTPGVSVKSEKTTPLEVPAGPLLCPPFGHSLFSVVSHVTCPSPFARGGCLAGEVRQEKWPDRPKIPRSWRTWGSLGQWQRGSGGQALQLPCLLDENDSGLFHAVSQRWDSMEGSEGPQANTSLLNFLFPSSFLLHFFHSLKGLSSSPFPIKPFKACLRDYF